MNVWCPVTWAEIPHLTSALPCDGSPGTDKFCEGATMHVLLLCQRQTSYTVTVGMCMRSSAEVSAHISWMKEASNAPFFCFCCLDLGRRAVTCRKRLGHCFKDPGFLIKSHLLKVSVCEETKKRRRSDAFTFQLFNSNQTPARVASLLFTFHKH